MRRSFAVLLLALFALALVGGCSGSNGGGSCPVTGGDWSLSYTLTNGTCGAMPGDTVVISFTSPLVDLAGGQTFDKGSPSFSGCAVHYAWSSSNQGLCPALASSHATYDLTATSGPSATTIAGTLTIDSCIAQPAGGPILPCSGTYTVSGHLL